MSLDSLRSFGIQNKYEFKYNIGLKNRHQSDFVNGLRIPSTKVTASHAWSQE